MQTQRSTLFLLILLSFSSLFPQWAYGKLNVGVTLHPYYSYVKNIVGDRADVTPLIAAGFNPHSYKLSPADLSRLNSMDVIVLNGIGHDEFAVEALRKLNLPGLEIISANESVPLISKQSGTKHNPHTFVSIDASIRQVYTIARHLGQLDQNNAKFFMKNALGYAKQLRLIKRHALEKISSLDLSNLRIASTHGAYGYLLQELGMTVSAVVEPAHGVSPSAAQLEETIKKIRDANVHVLFTELNMSNQYVDVIEKETSTKLFHFSHMTYGDYREELVLEDMGHNLETLVTALQYAAEKSH